MFLINNDKVELIFTDFSKDFYGTGHIILLKTLGQLYFNDTLVIMFASHLDQHTIYVFTMVFGLFHTH